MYAAVWLCSLMALISYLGSRTRVTDARHALRALVEDAKRSGYKCPIQAPPNPPSRIKDRVSHARRKPDSGKDKAERPRNAFFMFRSEMRSAHLFPESLPAFSKENNISCLTAIIWRALSTDEKAPWHRLAEQEKRILGFVVSSSSTATKAEYEEPKSEPEMWIIEVAELLLKGYQGEDLTHSTRAIMRRYGIEDAISPAATNSTPRGASGVVSTKARRSKPYTLPRIKRELFIPESMSPASDDAPVTPKSSPCSTSTPSLSNTPTTVSTDPIFPLFLELIKGPASLHSQAELIHRLSRSEHHPHHPRLSVHRQSAVGLLRLSTRSYK